MITKEQPEKSGTKKRVKRGNLESQLLPLMCAKPGTELKFTEIPLQSYPEGSAANDITKYSIDTSFVLNQMLSTWEK